MATIKAEVQRLDNSLKKSSWVKAENVETEYKKVYGEYISSVDDSITSFVNRVKKGEVSAKARLNIGTVDKKEIGKIEKITGVNVTGYSRVIKKDTIEHIDKRHGIKGKHDRTMSDVNDIGRINYVIENADNITPILTKDGNIKRTRAVQGKGGNMGNLIKYEKIINGHVYVVCAVADNERKEIQIISAYMNKVSKKEAPRVADVTMPPPLTSETDSWITS